MMAGRAMLGRTALAARPQTPAQAIVARGLAEKTYSERMAAKGRPVSPHVSIYAFPMVALSSITVRITGCLLTVGCSGVAAASLVGADVPGLMVALGNSDLGPLAKFSVSFPLIYHFLGGVRHTVWDYYPEAVQNASVEQASYALFGVATAASVGLSLTSFGTVSAETKKKDGESDATAEELTK